MQYIIPIIGLMIINLYAVHDRNELKGYPDQNQEYSVKYRCDTAEGISAMMNDNLDNDVIKAICELEEEK